MLLPYFMNLPDMLGKLPAVSSGGEYRPNYYYISYSFQELLEIEREKSRIPEIVRQAATQAVTQNYYSPKQIQDDEGLKVLKILTNAYQAEISKNDRKLLKLEIEYIRALQERDGEDWMILQ